MHLRRLELSGFKSFAKPMKLEFPASISAIVGPNGSGKSNVAEAIRWVLGEQSMKSLRGRRGEDLIFNGSQTASKLGKASVSLAFDNKKKIFPLDYEEVIITRKVFRDGVNEYLVNDAHTRLKDIIDLLSNVGLGASSHHIISQGEADRILSVNPKERRQMVEDALGLKIYQLKKQEGERKLAKTEENIIRVKELRREIQPHLNFLRKQMAKVEEADVMRENLRELCAEYFSREEAFLKRELKKLYERKHAPSREASHLEKDIAQLKDRNYGKRAEADLKNLNASLVAKESRLGAIRDKRNYFERDLGRLEGMLELGGEKGERGEETEMISSSQVRSYAEKLERHIEDVLYANSIEEIKRILASAKAVLKELLQSMRKGENTGKTPNPVALMSEEARVKSEIEKLEKERESLEKEIAKLKDDAFHKEKGLRDLEKDTIEIELRLNEARGNIRSIEFEEEKLKFRERECERDRAGAESFVHDLGVIQTGAGDLSLEEREKLRSKIERMKIKLEDLGGIGEETEREYEEVKTRDAFFDRELSDLDASKIELQKLMAELEEKIDTEFKTGVLKINKAFKKYFLEMFGGGNAELKIITSRARKRGEGEDIDYSPTEEDANLEAGEEGIEIGVSLPKKRIHSLDMLSGGERALTSIAVLFALSQVNPPPFLVLDETDAALDEANSRKYAAMLRSLGERTQLIVITHNRETMKQAGILYGVTMGADSISKLLSIKFIEAEQFINL